jgi:hypothetical protein
MKTETHHLPGGPVAENSSTGKKDMPADGDGRAKGMPDGVSGSPETGEMGQASGRSAGGESGGGAYPNPHSGRDPTNNGLLGHGGQTDNAYYGGDNPNATTKLSGAKTNETDPPPATEPEREPHIVETAGQSFEVVMESGVAAAEATGKVATVADYEREQETPGGG